MTDIIPALAGTAYDGVSVGQIATMTSGVAWNEDYTDPDSDVAKMLAVTPVAGESQAVTYARTLSARRPAGEKWVYKTLETNLLGLIVEQATGQSLAAYAAEKIVEPGWLRRWPVLDARSHGRKHRRLLPVAAPVGLRADGAVRARGR